VDKKGEMEDANERQNMRKRSRRSVDGGGGNDE
jgi:hypothetical protein